MVLMSLKEDWEFLIRLGDVCITSPRHNFNHTQATLWVYETTSITRTVTYKARGKNLADSLRKLKKAYEYGDTFSPSPAMQKMPKSRKGSRSTKWSDLKRNNADRSKSNQ